MTEPPSKDETALGDKRSFGAIDLPILERFGLLCQCVPLPIILFDSASLRIIEANADASTFYNFTRDQLLTKTISELSVDGSDGRTWEKRNSDGSTIAAEVAMQFDGIHDGRELTIVVLRALSTDSEPTNANNNPRGLAGPVRLEDQDPLTGLMNERAFLERLFIEANSAVHENMPLAVAVLDIDNFKFFNDAYSHSAGDEVLKMVASELRSLCRSNDALARFDGDEFVALMPGLSADAALDFPERTRRAMEHVTFQPADDGSSIPLAISVGIVVMPDETDNPEDAIQTARGRVLAAKSGADQESFGDRLRTIYSSSLSGFKMLDALTTSVDNKDHYTRRHSEDVAFYAVQIAVEMGVDPELLEPIQITGLIHDVGKIGVADHILRKPGKLSGEEYEAIKQHPVIGAMIVEASPELSFTLDGVRYHHEQWDGNGYPSGLAGENIPLNARIIAVADTYSAMTTNRPYRASMSMESALAIIRAGSGVNWDPECVAAFLRSMGERDDNSGDLLATAA